MQHRKAIGIVTTLIAAVGVSCVLHLVPHRRETVLAATGPEGVAVNGFATVDGERRELSGVLPQTWNFTASKFSFELHQTNSQARGKISITMSADHDELESEVEESVQGGCRFTGIGPFGDTETTMGGTWTGE